MAHLRAQHVAAAVPAVRPRRHLLSAANHFYLFIYFLVSYFFVLFLRLGLLLFLYYGLLIRTFDTMLFWSHIGLLSIYITKVASLLLNLIVC